MWMDGVSGGFSFLAALPDPALVVAPGQLVVAANSAMRGLLQGAADETPLINHFRAPAVLQAVKDCLSGGPATTVDYTERGQTTRRYELVVAPFEAGAPPAQHVLLILRDLTAQQQIESMRSDFVANASHEIRTPLATLAGFIETMQGAAKQDDAAREKFLAVMKAQTDRMTRLTDDLLSLSRIEMQEHQRPMGIVDLGLLISQTADGLKQAAAQAGFELKLAIKEIGDVPGDADQLQQVFQNLIENAIKYAGTGESIDISFDKSDQYTDVFVTDHGRGIAAHHLPRLTERFYRVDVQDSRTRGGTGLGLAIVKHILNRHRGRLMIYSNPGLGSRFTVRLSNV
jgi:two-component system, OmpR family, phosphate regulon sensor histidine kinase PhoR